MAKRGNKLGGLLLLIVLVVVIAALKKPSPPASPSSNSSPRQPTSSPDAGRPNAVASPVPQPTREAPRPTDQQREREYIKYAQLVGSSPGELDLRNPSAVPGRLAPEQA